MLFLGFKVDSVVVVSEGGPSLVEVKSTGAAPKQLPSFVDTCSRTEADQINTAMANFFYNENIPFSKIESEKFKVLINLLRPSYGRQHLFGATTLRTTMLNKAYDELKKTCRHRH